MFWHKNIQLWIQNLKFLLWEKSPNKDKDLAGNPQTLHRRHTADHKSINKRTQDWQNPSFTALSLVNNSAFLLLWFFTKPTKFFFLWYLWFYSCQLYVHNRQHWQAESQPKNWRNVSVAISKNRNGFFTSIGFARPMYYHDNFMIYFR